MAGLRYRPPCLSCGEEPGLFRLSELCEGLFRRRGEREAIARHSVRREFQAGAAREIPSEPEDDRPRDRTSEAFALEIGESGFCAFHTRGRGTFHASEDLNIEPLDPERRRDATNLAGDLGPIPIIQRGDDEAQACVAYAPEIEVKRRGDCIGLVHDTRRTERVTRICAITATEA